MEALFKGLFDAELTNVISLENFLLCLGTALVLGLIMAFAFMFKARYTKSFASGERYPERPLLTAPADR